MSRNLRILLNGIDKTDEISEVDVFNNAKPKEMRFDPVDDRPMEMHYESKEYSAKAKLTWFNGDITEHAASDIEIIEDDKCPTLIPI